MDTVHNWKRILLQWIRKCNFLEKPFYNIEQSEIEVFFAKFKEYIKNDCHNLDLCSFLKENYPSFEPHFDDENALSSGDYVYVYSLLLHFSCVKCPDEFFQKKCQELNESIQQDIATFFKKLFDLENLSKESLRHVIASTAMSPSSSSIQFMFTDSPIKTPRKNDISPPTPRSCILRERNKELYNLKTQLENEIYEKGILELEVKQNQDKIVKLSQEIKKSRQELLDLRNDIVSRNMENNLEMKQSEEQINRKLCKQISQKEQEIAQQREDIDALIEQNSILSEKLIHAEKQIKADQTKVEELVMKVDELAAELEQKEVTIQYLSEVKLELEQYISEIRSSSASSRPDLNVSAECLDLSRTTNSSGSMNSPENLGCSVVDIQLREKENENIQLRDELSMIRLNNCKLSKHMNDLTTRYSKFFEGESIIFDQETGDPIENFLVFSNYVEKFVKKYDENCLSLKELRECSKTIENENRVLSSKVIEAENEAANLKKEIINLLASNKTLEKIKESLESEKNEWESRFAINFKEKLELEKEIERLQVQMQEFNIKHQTDVELNSKLKADLENKELIVKSLTSESVESKRQIEKLDINSMNMKIQFESVINNLEKRITELAEEVKEKETKLHNYNLERHNLEDKINCLKDQHNCIEHQFQEQIDAKDALLHDKNKEVSEFKEENTTLFTELGELRQKFDYLLNEKNQLQHKNEEAHKKNVSLEKLLDANEQTIQKYLNEVKHLQLLISTFTIEKTSLINSIQLRVDSFRTGIDELEIYFGQKISRFVEENEIIVQKLALTETNLTELKNDLHYISCKYNQSQDLLFERTEDFKKIIDEFNTGLKAVVEKYNIKLSNETSEANLFSVSCNSIDSVDNLKQYLNTLVQELQELYAINSKKESEIVNLLQNIGQVTLQKKDLEERLILSERRVFELREDFESEKQCEVNKLTNEVRRLNEVIINLENVCDHLSDENTSIQTKLSKYEAIIDKLKEENNLLLDTNSCLETDRSHQLTVADKLMKTETELQSQVVNMQSAVNQLENDIEAVQSLLLIKTQDAEALLEERNQAECTIATLRNHIIQLESKISALEINLKGITDKYETSNKQVEETALNQCCKLDELKEQLQNEIINKNNIASELDCIIGQMSERKKEKIALEDKCQIMETQLEKYRKELDCSKTDLYTLQFEETKLLDDLQLMKEASLLKESHIEILKKEIMEQKENVSQLIKEISSIRKEKDTLKEENSNLKKHLEEKTNAVTLLDSQCNVTVEKLKIMENDLLAKQNLLKSEQLKSMDFENQLTKLQMENVKLKETTENNVKRMEKQALKLGESQAKSLRLKKETETALNNFECLKSSSETMTRENSKLNLECKSLMEKLAKCEKTCDQLESQIQQIEKEKDILRTEKENIETSENKLKITIASLEKNKFNLEDKVRKLAKSLSESNVALSRLEQDKVQLNLEIGGLNTELKECKTLVCMKLKEIQDVTQNLIEVKNTNLKLMELNEKLQFDATEIQDENIRLNDELSKISLRLSITQEGYENTKTELDALRSDIVKKRQETEVIEKEHITAKERLKEIEDIVVERQTTEADFIEKIKYLEEQLVKLSLDIRSLEEIRKQEKQTNEKLNTDISILQAKLQKSRSICDENEKKWSEEKQQLLGEVKTSEDRIKETRLELEGKLEKMKNKMKTLYNDEIAKMKKKQERECNIMKSEVDSLKAQNDKYEENTKKLAAQIFRLNENILEYQKQNTFLQTKLKDIDTEPHKINRVVSSHIAQSSTHHALGSNLHMEDEEGEVFNNTYLSDLKNGKMPEAFGRGISPQELQHRNSLRPPHLKTAYFAQYDHQMGEDEIRVSTVVNLNRTPGIEDSAKTQCDIPNLDDSLSTLLNTGQRKKVSGATSYKRPGPPTPSKNAGRLSFGGNGEPCREILKETSDVGNSHSSLKTPAKFKLFSSRHSIKDEYKNSLDKITRRKQILGAIQCSSTPRKSKAHFDQRRILDQIMSAARAARENSVDSFNSPLINLPPSLTSLELVKRNSQKYRRSQLLRAATESEASELKSPRYKNDKFEKAFKLKHRRCSIYLKGGMFARNSRTSKRDSREVFKNRSKVQRNVHFNKYRSRMLSNFIKSPSHPSSNSPASSKETTEFDCDETRELNIYSHNNHGLINDNKNYESSKIFKKLLIEKVSQAPFEISEIIPSMHSNVNSSSNIHSRTIYGTSVILNRRIPNVNTTHIRKSSIYVKSNDGNGIILVTNQTITLLDLAQMWIQMNISAKLFISLSLITLFMSMIICAFQLIF